MTKQNTVEMPRFLDLSFLDKPLSEMTNGEIYARAQIEQLTPGMVALIRKFQEAVFITPQTESFHDFDSFSKRFDELAAASNKFTALVERILWDAQEIVGELEDENGINSTRTE